MRCLSTAGNSKWTTEFMICLPAAGVVVTMGETGGNSCAAAFRGAETSLTVLELGHPTINRGAKRESPVNGTRSASAMVGPRRSRGTKTRTSTRTSIPRQWQLASSMSLLSSTTQHPEDDRSSPRQEFHLGPLELDRPPVNEGGKGGGGHQHEGREGRPRRPTG